MTAIVTDSFTGTDATALTSHTGELGATWTKHASANSTGDPQILSNKLVTTETGKNENYYTSGVPASADYEVSLDYTYNSTSVSDEICGPAGRMSTSVNTGYFFIWFRSTGTLRLYKYVAGSLSLIGTALAWAPATGVPYRLTLSMNGTALACRVQRISDGFWLTTAGSGNYQSGQVDCITATDSAITAAGRAGFWFSCTVSVGVRGTMDNFAAQDFAVAPSVTPGVGSLAITGYAPSITVTGGNQSANPGAGNLAITGYAPSVIQGAIIKYTQVNSTDTIGGQSIMVLVPNSNSAVPYNSANPTPVILYAHGNGETQTALLSDSLKAGCVDALLDAGYILAGTNGHGSNWGAQPAVDDYMALEKYVRDNYNVKGVGIWSQSMGGLTGLSAITQGKIKDVVGWLGTYPVCNLSAMYAGGAGGYATTINTSFGITGSGNATYANLTYGMDPALRSAGEYRSIPMRFYASAGDTVVPKVSNTDILRAIVLANRREADLIVCTGNHGDPSHFIPSEYVAFFNRCFANRTVTVSTTLTSDGVTPLANLTGLSWVVSEVSPTGALLTIGQGSGAVTNGSGVFTVTFSGRPDAGAVLRVSITNSDGTTTQNPPAKAFTGPITVS